MPPRLEPEYEDIIDNYTDEEEMCNDLGLNYDEVFVNEEKDPF